MSHTGLPSTDLAVFTMTSLIPSGGSFILPPSAYCTESQSSGNGFGLELTEVCVLSGSTAFLKKFCIFQKDASAREHISFSQIFKI